MPTAEISKHIYIYIFLRDHGMVAQSTSHKFDAYALNADRPLSGLKGVKPNLQFGERTRDCSPGNAGKEEVRTLPTLVT